MEDPGPPRLALRGRMAFMVGDFSFNLIFSGTAIFLLYVYTDVFGLPPILAGAIYMAALFLDAVTDPIIGALADRTRTPFGRFRPYILLGAPILAATYPLAYWRPEFAAGWIAGWALLTHCALRFTYGLVSIPFTGLSSRVSLRSDERTSIAGYRMLGAATGGLTAATITPRIIAVSPSQASGYVNAALVAAVLILVCLWYCAWVLKEPEEAPVTAETDRITIFQDIVRAGDFLKTNGPLVRVFLSFVCVSLAGTMFSKCLIYYFKYVLRDPAAAAYGLMIPGFTMLVTVPFWVLIANRTSKRTTWLIAAGGSVLGYMFFFFNGSSSNVIAFASITWISAFNAAYGVMLWSMLPDTVEYEEAQTGERPEARVNGFASFAQKSSLGVNALLLGVLLNLSGYVANKQQAATTVLGIKAIMTLIPLLGVLVSSAIMRRYPIDQRFHANLLSKIAQNSRPAPD